jgi:ketosteroid isomerase-like protein
VSSNLDSAADKQAIEQNQATFIERGNAGDVDGVMMCCSDDIVMMPPNAPAVVGAVAVRAWFEGFFEQFEANLTTATEDLVVDGDLAYARRSFAWTVTPKAEGEPIHESGKTVLIYKRDAGGTWKAALDIWNSD